MGHVVKQQVIHKSGLQFTAVNPVELVFVSLSSQILMSSEFVQRGQCKHGTEPEVVSGSGVRLLEGFYSSADRTRRTNDRIQIFRLV